MTYIDGFILPIQRDNFADYAPMAETFARKAKEQGALGSLEAIGDGLEPWPDHRFLQSSPGRGR